MRALTIIDATLLVYSNIHSFEMHALIYDKLLIALTKSECSELILNKEEWLMLLESQNNTVLMRDSLSTIDSQPTMIILTLLYNPFSFVRRC